MKLSRVTRVATLTGTAGLALLIGGLFTPVIGPWMAVTGFAALVIGGSVAAITVHLVERRVIAAAAERRAHLKSASQGAMTAVAMQPVYGRHGRQS